MKSVLMRCPKCLKTSELDNLHLLDHSFKREWIGLTDEEIAKIILDEFGSVSPPHGFSQDSMVEAFKLGAAHGIKEKNT